MDFSFSDEQEAIRDLARRIFSDHGENERLREVEASEEGVDRALWSALAQASLLGIADPEAQGGGGLGVCEVAILLEEQGRAVVQVPLWSHLLLGVAPLERFGSDAQKRRWLAPAIAGEAMLTAALTEPGAFDSERPRVAAKAEGEGWRLEGEKTCVPAGPTADRIWVPARTGEDTISVFGVDPRAPGARIEPQRATNHELQGRLVLDGLRATRDDVLGEPDRGDEVVRFVLERALVGLCALQLGVAEEALRRTAEYTSTRKQFGRAIATFQGVSLRAADAFIDVEALRSTLWQAMWRIDSGAPAALQAAVAKWWACRGGQRVVHTAMHLHGGIGADVDYPIHRYFLWSKQIDLSLGGAGVWLARLGARVAAGEARES